MENSGLLFKPFKNYIIAIGGKRIYHAPDCQYIKKIPNKLYFFTWDAIKESKLIPCQFCWKLKKKIKQKDKKYQNIKNKIIFPLSEDAYFNKEIKLKTTFDIDACIEFDFQDLPENYFICHNCYRPLPENEFTAGSSPSLRGSPYRTPCKRCHNENQRFKMYGSIKPRKRPKLEIKLDEDKLYYVYVWLDKRNKIDLKYKKFKFEDEVKYIGKGKNNRCFDIDRQYNEKLMLWIKDSGKFMKIIKIAKNLTEFQAFDLERKLINYIGRNDLHRGSLLNKTFGFDGVSFKNAAGKFVVISPIGRILFIKGLKSFCMKHKLNQGNMSNVAYGRNKSHKKWKCFTFEKWKKLPMEEKQGYQNMNNIIINNKGLIVSHPDYQKRAGRPKGSLGRTKLLEMMKIIYDENEKCITI